MNKKKSTVCTQATFFDIVYPEALDRLYDNEHELISTEALYRMAPKFGVSTEQMDEIFKEKTENK